MRHTFRRYSYNKLSDKPLLTQKTLDSIRIRMAAKLLLYGFWLTLYFFRNFYQNLFILFKSKYNTLQNVSYNNKNSRKKMIQ